MDLDEANLKEDHMQSLCVFCGSSKGLGQKYMEMGRELGKELALAQIDLVYGGASVGVMGAVADGALENQGRVIGVMPRSLIEWEVEHKNLTEFIAVETMHERKQLMYERSDAFVALPGGFGTMDEMCEILTWRQLKYHQRPCFVLNFEGYYDHLLAQFKRMNQEAFLKLEHLEMVIEVKTVRDLINHLKQFKGVDK